MNFVYYGHKADQVNPALDGVRECDELNLWRETPWGRGNEFKYKKNACWLYGKHDAMRWGWG